MADQNEIEREGQVDASNVESVEQSPDAPSAVGTGNLAGVGLVVLVALVLSYLISRVARVQNAHSIRRWLPLAYVTVWGCAVAAVTTIVSAGLPDSWRLVVWLVFLLVIFASVGWLRSVMSGVALAIEGRIQEGDAIRIEDVEGEIVTFGLRSIRLRSVDGTLHEIPNTKFVTESVANISGDGGDSACEIALAVPTSIEPTRALEIAREIAILTPLASPRHRAEVFLHPPETPTAPFKVLIRGYAFDPTYQEHFRSDVVARFAEATGARPK